MTAALDIFVNDINNDTIAPTNTITNTIPNNFPILGLLNVSNDSSDMESDTSNTSDNINTKLDQPLPPIQSSFNSPITLTPQRSFMDTAMDSDDEETDINCAYDNDYDIIEPLTLYEQLHIFVSGYMPHKYPTDIIHLISNTWLDPEFKWSLGLLEWRPYSYKTKTIAKDIYGYSNNTNYNILELINYGISKCIAHKQFDIDNIRKDIMETSPNKSWLVYFIMKEFEILANKMEGVELFRAKCKIHNMLYRIVSLDDLPSLTTLHPTHSNSRDIRVMALQSLPSPPMGFELSTSMSMSLGSIDSYDSLSPLSLTSVMNDIELDSSFILDTYQHEYPERKQIDTIRLQNLLLTWNRIPGTNNNYYIDDYIIMDINDSKYDVLDMNAGDIINEEMDNILDDINKPYIISKIIDIINRKGVIMNIINLFTELRMANHYIEMFRRKHCEWIVNCSSTINNHCKKERDPFEPFIYNNILEMSEFLRNYPLFETLRNRSKKYDYIIHCMTSTITYLTTKIMRPLPFQPTHIINDSYCDYLMYTSQISRFIYNKIINQNRFNKFKYLDNIILNALHFPIQLDFLIIPQCVSEYKIKYQLNPIITNNKQYNKLLFKSDYSNKLICNIGDLLDKNGIEYSSFDIDREPAQFYKVLTRGFDKIQKKNKLNTFDKRYCRYIFIIDRRNPNNNKYDGKYFINNNEKNWKDKLYIFSPGKYNKISLKCDIIPEGFINRSMKYLLPINNNEIIGANCVCNGYIFAQSYHLFQEDKIKKYFHYNGYTQRFTKDELKYYFPRLFMKINNKFQNEINIKNNNAHLKMFKEIKDNEHYKFHQQTMK